ncbi:cyclopropane fatty acyl phospholipid synthase [Echinicola marina]|uniref:cyclopropane fatty acyl phospholipid synthase n=1 Tax=Echinicola marina TaxID=2859768 RepID=UPI001CF626BA|nr:cyclopropane fatty acyl phospholipid synthase [Echinicola marina]UCS92910.1 cyclopropane fatty acyl phospholipid synthase [Echinicola marina]
MDAYQKTIQELLAHAGICVNGAAQYDIQVKDHRFYKKVLSEGSLGLGEAYMDGWWECEALDEFFNKLLRAKLHQKVKGNLKMFWQGIKAKLFNLQSITLAKNTIVQHYNIGNTLYEKMLDKYMMYSCAYWEEARDLDEAQEKKLELICRKLKLSAGMRVLDIGCGWGGFATYAARNYQVEVVGLTLSEKQAELAKVRCRGLDVEIRLQDYREVNESFDRVLSIGMMEHVGLKNHRKYMEVVNKNLKDGGISLLHTIGKYATFEVTDPWIDKYIFPNSLIPSAAQLTKAMEGYFHIEDWHNFGLYYDNTLMAWLDRFKAAWDSIKEHYDHRFYRMWQYYLSCSAGSFRARQNHLWQIVMVKDTFKGEYKAVRSLCQDQIGVK